MSQKLDDDLELVMGVLVDVLGSRISNINKDDVIKKLSETEEDESDEFDYSGSYHPYKRINQVAEHFISLHKKRKQTDCINDYGSIDNLNVNAELISPEEEKREDDLLASLVTVYPDIDPKFLKQICSRLNNEPGKIQEWIEENIEQIPEKRQVQAINRFALESTCRSHEDIWKCPSCEMWQIIEKNKLLVKCKEVISCGEFCMKCNRKDHSPFQCRQKCARIDNLENEFNIFKKLRAVPDEDKGYAKIFILKPQNNLNFSDPLHILYLAAEGTFLRMMEMSDPLRSTPLPPTSRLSSSRQNLSAFLNGHVNTPLQVSSLSTGSSSSTITSANSNGANSDVQIINVVGPGNAHGPTSSSKTTSTERNGTNSDIKIIPSIAGPSSAINSTNEKGPNLQAQMVSNVEWEKEKQISKDALSLQGISATNMSCTSTNVGQNGASNREETTNGATMEDVIPIPSSLSDITVISNTSTSADEPKKEVLDIPEMTSAPSATSSTPLPSTSTKDNSSANGISPTNLAGEMVTVSSPAGPTVALTFHTKPISRSLPPNLDKQTNKSLNNVPEIPSPLQAMSSNTPMSSTSKNDNSLENGISLVNGDENTASKDDLFTNTNGAADERKSSNKPNEYGDTFLMKQEKSACAIPDVNPTTSSAPMPSTSTNQSNDSGNGICQNFSNFSKVNMSSPSGSSVSSVAPTMVAVSSQAGTPLAPVSTAAARRFALPMIMSRKSIKSIKYIENENLRGRFNSCKSYFLSRGIPNGERLAFHGTSANLDSIIKDNLQLSRCKRFAFGKGIYFSEFPETSQIYGKHLLLFRVMLGNPYHGHELTIPEQFQSKIVRPNQEGKASMIIIDKEEQILPAFIIELEDICGTK